MNWGSCGYPRCSFFFFWGGNTCLIRMKSIAEASREMLVTHNYFIPQINFEPFWEKPPLFFWLQSLSLKLFGINEFAARFPNPLCGIITLMVLFRMGQKLLNKT